MLAPSAHADESKQCVMYIDQQDAQHLHVQTPVCFDSKGDVVMNSFDEIMHITSRQTCAVDEIQGVERVDPVTFLVRKFCKGGKPEYQTLVFQLVDDGDGGTIRITNAENS
jgi:hypothetical protein